MEHGGPFQLQRVCGFSAQRCILDAGLQLHPVSSLVTLPDASAFNSQWPRLSRILSGQQFLRHSCSTFVTTSTRMRLAFAVGKTDLPGRCSKLAQALVGGCSFSVLPLEHGTSIRDPFDPRNGRRTFQFSRREHSLRYTLARIVRKLAAPGVRGCDVTADYQKFRSAIRAKSVLGIPSASRLYRYGSPGRGKREMPYNESTSSRSRRRISMSLHAVILAWPPRTAPAGRVRMRS